MTTPGIVIQQGQAGAPPHQQLPDVMYVVGTAPNPTDSGYVAGSVIVTSSGDTDALFGTVGTIPAALAGLHYDANVPVICYTADANAGTTG